jgi:uncharacterized protein
MQMTLYIDGDAFPNILKPILFRAIKRLKLQTIVISNKRINIGESNYITYIIVGSGMDETDQHIVEMIKEGDLVITADIPLADRVITKKALAIDHRGKLFSDDNIKQYLAMRNLMQDIRESGEFTKGPKPINKKEAHKFANQFNKILSKQK